MRVTTSSPRLILGWFVSLWMIIDHSGSVLSINRLCCDGSGAIISPPASFFVNAVSRETLQTTVCVRIYIYMNYRYIFSRSSLVLPIFLFDVIFAVFLDINDWKRSNA
jgi:hypothetical protein